MSDARSDDAHRDRMARRSRERASEVAEIGPLPPIVNPRRRESCRLDLFRALTTYFPHSTGLKPFSDDHRGMIARMQHAVLCGARTINAIYRGAAKTTITENTAIWSAAYGHSPLVTLFGSNVPAARQILNSIKEELEGNDLLLEDFPELCFPIRALEGKHQRCDSQTQNGIRTHIGWTSDCVAAPWIFDSKTGQPVPSAGNAIYCLSILSARGFKHKRPDGVNQRPTLAIVDDPQTDDSAVSDRGVQKRLRILRSSIAKLAGPHQTPAIICNATVIAKDDMIDQLLTRPENRAWMGERIPMVKRFPDAHQDLWLDQYARRRHDYDPTDPDDQARAHAAATAYYKRHRKKMDSGAEVSWVHCYDPETELSAVQHAYNVLIDDGPDAFASECQQEPTDPAAGTGVVTLADVLKKLSGHARRRVPNQTTVLTGHVDVHDDLLYWMLIAWEPTFTGVVIDYGTYPEQPRRSLALRNPRTPLKKVHPGTTKEAAVEAGLKTLFAMLLDPEQPYLRADGKPQAVDLVGVDIGYFPTVVENAIRQTRSARRIVMTRGVGITATKRPLRDWTYKPGDVRGHYWGLFRRSRRELPSLEFDANRWKSIARDRILAASGDAGSLSLYGASDQAPHHAELADAWTSEYPVEVSAAGRTVEEWKLKPNRDNHPWDNLVGAAVVASRCGVTLPGVAKPPAPKKRKKKKATYL